MKEISFNFQDVSFDINLRRDESKAKYLHFMKKIFCNIYISFSKKKKFDKLRFYGQRYWFYGFLIRNPIIARTKTKNRNPSRSKNKSIIVINPKYLKRN